MGYGLLYIQYGYHTVGHLPEHITVQLQYGLVLYQLRHYGHKQLHMAILLIIINTIWGHSNPPFQSSILIYYDWHNLAPNDLYHPKVHS
jgi:hypothetical protein